MRYGTRATLTAAAITVMGVAGVAAGLAAGPSRSGPSAPVGSVPGDGSQARVGNVICGQTLTESTIVENDLANCPGDGLVAGADGITIDLNGHMIDGQTIPTGNGIAISGFDGVVVENGTITGFDVGVSIVLGADRTRVRDLRISGDGIGNGIEAQALRAAITGNTVFGRAIGILVAGTATTTAGNTVKDNRDPGRRQPAGRHPEHRPEQRGRRDPGGRRGRRDHRQRRQRERRRRHRRRRRDPRDARRQPRVLQHPARHRGRRGRDRRRTQRGDGQRQPAPVRERRLRRGAVTLEGCVRWTFVRSVELAACCG